MAGVDSAQWLFSQTNTAGTRQSCARLSDSWKVPMLVAPSPKKALDHARSGKGPVLLHCDTYRLHGHYIGDPQVYRSKEEQQDVREHHDPLTDLRGRLELSDEEFDEVDREVTEIVEASVEFAKAGTDPKPEDALKNVYA